MAHNVTPLVKILRGPTIYIPKATRIAIAAALEALAAGLSEWQQGFHQLVEKLHDLQGAHAQTMAQLQELQRELAGHRANAEVASAKFEAQRADLERQRADFERQRTDLEAQRTDLERQRAEFEADLAGAGAMDTALPCPPVQVDHVPAWEDVLGSGSRSTRSSSPDINDHRAAADEALEHYLKTIRTNAFVAEHQGKRFVCGPGWQEPRFFESLEAAYAAYPKLRGVYCDIVGQEIPLFLADFDNQPAKTT